MSDNRNIIDHFKYWKTESIKANLDEKRHNFSVLCQNIGIDYNLGQVVRCSNAFLAKNVYIYGRKRWDKRAAVGTHHYSNMKHVVELDSLPELPTDTLWVAVDNIDGATPVEDFNWPKDRHTLMCFGQEDIGLHGSILERCTERVYIRQFGSVRSLNIGCSSGIIMQDYCRKL